MSESKRRFPSIFRNPYGEEKNALSLLSCWQRANNNNNTRSVRAVATIIVGCMIVWVSQRSAAKVFRNDLITEAQKQSTSYKSYIPAPGETYVVEHAKELGYDMNVDDKTKIPPTCTLWNNETHSDIHGDLQMYLKELEDYEARLLNFKGSSDIRRRMQVEGKAAVCDSLELHQDGLKGIFKNSGQLSYSSSGYIEPLLPPMRHPKVCVNGREHLFDLGYLIHDFSALCRKTKPTSRFVLVDMGASLDFHSSGDENMPAIYLTSIFDKFGFPFDQ